MKCDMCHDTPPPLVCAIDEPEQEGGLMFGDQLLGVLLCLDCLAVSEEMGPWSLVVGLDVAA